MSNEDSNRNLPNKNYLISLIAPLTTYFTTFLLNTILLQMLNKSV